MVVHGTLPVDPDDYFWDKYNHMDLFRFPEQFSCGNHCRPHLREAMERQGIVGRTCNGKKPHAPGPRDSANVPHFRDDRYNNWKVAIS